MYIYILVQNAAFIYILADVVFGSCNKILLHNHVFN